MTNFIIANLNREKIGFQAQGYHPLGCKSYTPQMMGLTYLSVYNAKEKARWQHDPRLRNYIYAFAVKSLNVSKVVYDRMHQLKHLLLILYCA